MQSALFHLKRLARGVQVRTAVSGPVGTMSAVRITEYGASSILKVEQVPIPKVLPGQILIRNRYAGLNFIDCYHRAGFIDCYPRNTPFILGVEGGGEIVDPGFSKDFRVGDRVVYYSPTAGSYCEYSAIDASQVLYVPKGIDLDVAMACVVQGMTAHFLARSTCAISSGDWVVVRSAAGGTGQLLCQIAKLSGAKVIATVSSVEKANIAHLSGADHVITHDKLVQCVQEHACKTHGVRVVFDGVGKSTLQQNLDCLAPRGMLVLYAQASGAVPPIDPLTLAAKGSIFITRPRLTDYIRNRTELEWRARELVQWIREGKLKVKIDKVFKLEDAHKAHDYTETSQTVGKVLIQVA